MIEAKEPSMYRSYPSGNHKCDGVKVLDTYSVADLKDAIWWLFYGSQSNPVTGCVHRSEDDRGQGMWLRGIVQALGQGDDFRSELRDPESLLICIRNIHNSIDLDIQKRKEYEDKERVEYERLKAKFGDE